MNKKIGIFDSGLGGLSILKELLKILPNEDYLLYEDSLHNPYGDKTEEELLMITSNIVDYLLEQDCKIIVIACNTATTCCMESLRKMYPNTIFVGTVPAIKVACDFNYKNTILLSTPYTSKSKRVRELIHNYKNPDQEIFLVSGENLAHLIELNDIVNIRLLLNKLLLPFKGKVDSIVLGCTHYPLIKEEILKVLPGVSLLDGGSGVAREVRHQLEKRGLLSNAIKKGKLYIVNTLDDSYIDKSFKILNS